MAFFASPDAATETAVVSGVLTAIYTANKLVEAVFRRRRERKAEAKARHDAELLEAADKGRREELQVAAEKLAREQREAAEKLSNEQRLANEVAVETVKGALEIHAKQLEEIKANTGKSADALIAHERKDDSRFEGIDTRFDGLGKRLDGQDRVLAETRKDVHSIKTTLTGFGKD